MNKEQKKENKVKRLNKYKMRIKQWKRGNK